MSLIFACGSPLRHCQLPLGVFVELAKFDDDAAASQMLTSILVRQIECAEKVELTDLQTKQTVDMASVIRHAGQYDRHMFYVTEQSQPPADTQQAPPAASAASEAAASAASVNPSSSIFSLRLPSQTHRQVYLSELTDLVELRAYTQRIPLELLWEMLSTVLQSAAHERSTGALSREALVALLHALISHIGEREPELFPAALRPPPGKPITIPASVTASILKLHEMVMYDAQHLQEADAPVSRLDMRGQKVCQAVSIR